MVRAAQGRLEAGPEAREYGVDEQRSDSVLVGTSRNGQSARAPLLEELRLD